jgi:hypothetical protein
MNCCIRKTVIKEMYTAILPGKFSTPLQSLAEVFKEM